MSAKELMTEGQGLLNTKEGVASDMTRRTAVKAALGVGYAASAAPIMAQTAIKTSSDGLDAGEVVIEVDGFKMNAYRAAPKGKKSLPVILVVQEIFGVHEYIADTCRRFAKLGYLAISAELFQRQGDPTKYNVIADVIREVVSKVPDDQVMKDLDACVAWAAKNGGDSKRVGITGFCWGGRITWLFASHNKNVKAGVAWYGRLVGVNNAMNPTNPVDRANELKGPVLGLYGGADTGIPQDTVDRMTDTLAAAGVVGNKAAKASKFHVYPATPHAFHADYRPSFRKEAAEDGWKRALAWFKANGV
jgi:carboxymethylenebutenolidase